MDDGIVESLVLVFAEDPDRFHLRAAKGRRPICEAFDRDGMLTVRFNLEATGAVACPDCLSVRDGKAKLQGSD